MDEINFNTDNDINIKITKKDGGVVFNEDCCTCINILLTNDGKIATSFMGCHNPYIVMQLEKAQKLYFKELKKALKRDFKEYGVFPDEDECDCHHDEECDCHHEHCDCGCEDECDCDETCDCGCQEGKECTCGGECECGCGCDDECDCEDDECGCGDSCECDDEHDCGCGSHKHEHKHSCNCGCDETPKKAKKTNKAPAKKTKKK